MSVCILALETATHACSAALLYDEHILYREAAGPKQHSQLILPMLESLLAEAGLVRTQLDVIAFGCGPGNFTGVRLATSIAQATAFALDIPVVPVSTLRALAQGAWRIGQHRRVLVALDARLQQVYWGYYQLGEGQVIAPCTSERVCDPNALTVPDPWLYGEADSWIGIGSGWDIYSTSLQHALSCGEHIHWLAGHYPQAQDISVLAWHDYRQGFQVAPELVTPVYLRDQVVHSPSLREQ